MNFKTKKNLLIALLVIILASIVSSYLRVKTGKELNAIQIELVKTREDLTTCILTHPQDLSECAPIMKKEEQLSKQALEAERELNEKLGID